MCQHTVGEIAEWFISKPTGRGYFEGMTLKKLNYLVYYYYAWGLALYGEEMIKDVHFIAKPDGLYCPELWEWFFDTFKYDEEKEEFVRK